MKKLVPALFAALMLFGLAGAVDPEEALDDPQEEQRAREISRQLRCVVCQNQSIDESDAELARDLRLLVRERIEAGDSDEEVVDYIVARYGEFVLLRPRFEGEGIVLWLLPLMLVAVGTGLVVMVLRGRTGERPVMPQPLSAEEQAELDRLLAEAGEEPNGPDR